MLGVLFNTDRMDGDAFVAYARRLDALGYESLWLPELFTRDPFTAAAHLLAHTDQIKLATGIANIYGRDPVATITASSTLQELSGDRFILGLGVSNKALNAARGHAWENPVTKLSDYLTAMAAVKMTTEQRVAPTHVAAHGPRMLEVAAALADGANTYLMPPDHVDRARRSLGDKTLNTMLFCAREPDAALARAKARKALAYYVGLDYYHRAWRSLGFADEDFSDGGSDRLIDALVAHGTVDDIRDRIATQRARGASRVVLIPLGTGGQPDWTLLEALV